MDSVSRLTVAGALVLAGCVVVACSDTKHPSSSVGTGANGSVAGTRNARGGSAQTAGGAGGADSSMAGRSAGGDAAGRAGVGGNGEPSAGSSSLGGAGVDPIPPEGDPPLCPQGLSFGEGTALLQGGGREQPPGPPLSAAGDDLLLAITPDERTIAWKNGEHVYIADRDDVTYGFGAPLEVTGGATLSGVALSSDGLTLIGVQPDLSVVELGRAPGQAFVVANAASGGFAQFNATRAAIPVANQALTDLVMGGDAKSFFFSHFSTSYTGSYATLFESQRSGETWPFTSPSLGEILHASDQKRRQPTGVSIDLLTLFYWDEVNEDFRAAWRVNSQVPFEHSEVLELGSGLRAAAPNGNCTRIHYSAQGKAGLDLFVADVLP